MPARTAPPPGRPAPPARARRARTGRVRGSRSRRASRRTMPTTRSAAASPRAFRTRRSSPVSSRPETREASGAAGHGRRRPDPAPSTGARARAAAGDLPAHLAGIEVTLSVEIGRARLALSDLMAVEPGQLFDLDTLVSEPVSILVNGRPFATGEVLAVGDRFGVRILALAEPSP